MRPGKLLSLLAVTAFLVPAPAMAQESSTTFYVTPWIATGFFGGSVGMETSGTSGSSEKSTINNAPAWGLFGGIRLGGRIMVEGVVSYTASTILTQTTTSSNQSLQIGYGLSIITFGGNVGYAFSTSKTSVVPYLIAGAGGMSFSPADEGKALPTQPDSKTEFMFNFGGGVEIPISSGVRLRIDLRDYIASTNAPFAPFPGTQGGEGESSSLNMILFSGGVSIGTP